MKLLGMFLNVLTKQYCVQRYGDSEEMHLAHRYKTVCLLLSEVKTKIIFVSVAYHPYQALLH